MQSEDNHTFENASSSAVPQEHNTFAADNQFNQNNHFENNGAFQPNNNFQGLESSNHQEGNDLASLEQHNAMFQNQIENNNNQQQNTLEWNLQRARETSNMEGFQQGNQGSQRGMEMDNPTSDTSDGDLRGELEMLIADDEEEGNEKEPDGKFRTKNEQAVDPNIVNLEETLEQRYQRLHVNPENVNHLVPIGRIEFIMNEFITVQSQAENVVDLDGILFLDNKVPLGKIDDVFGQVDLPKYTLINDLFLKSRVANQEMKVGDVVYFDPLLSKVLPPTQIEIMKSRRGCDASNRFDEEALYEEEVEFSDDEKEQEFGKSKKQQRKDKKSKHGQKMEQKEDRQAHILGSNTVYNQGRVHISAQNPHMYNSQMTPMNQLNQMNHQMNYQQHNQFQPMNQYPMNNGMNGGMNNGMNNGMNGMMQMHPMQNMQNMQPMQNMPLFFNPMMNQQMQAPMQGGFQGYPQQQQQQQPQNFMPTNNLFQYNNSYNGGM